MKSMTKTKLVLVIEPDEVQAKLIESSLKSQNWTIQSTYSAQSAIAMADKNRPDIVVLELVLPRHNGIEFLHEFRSYPEWSQIPIVIFSLQYLDDRTLLDDLGAINYLYKPQTTLARLKEVISEILL